MPADVGGGGDGTATKRQGSVRQRKKSAKASTPPASPAKPPAPSSRAARFRQELLSLLDGRVGLLDEAKEGKIGFEVVHRAQDSLFSSTSGYTNYRGFFNLAILLLVLSNSRVALENIIKYGILVDPGQILGWLLSDKRTYLHFCSLLGSLGVFPSAALVVERLAARGTLAQGTAYALHTLVVVGLLAVPAAGSLWTGLSPFSSCALLMAVSCLSLKLVSYAQVNAWCRAGAIPSAVATSNGSVAGLGGRRRVTYPENLTAGNLLYFVAAPTLCYELNFPRLPRRRKLFMVKRAVEVACLSQLIIALAQQWIVPLLVNSQRPFSNMDWPRMAERAMKLAMPNHLIWLLNFYLLFHSWLNLWAEVIGFADREFYRDWWNAETIGYFWQAWNIPVHRWCSRHVFKPLRSRGWGSFSAATWVFVVSAFYHEYLVSVPLQMFRLWAFVGMLAQIPLNVITTKLLGGGVAGNVTVWLSLILGQPMAILTYVHDYYLLHFLPTQ